MEPNPTFTDPARLNAFLAELRRNGTSPIEAIKIVREKQRISLGEAKRIVFNSPAWSDAREEQAKLIDEIFAALESE